LVKHLTGVSLNSSLKGRYNLRKGAQSSDCAYDWKSKFVDDSQTRLQQKLWNNSYGDDRLLPTLKRLVSVIFLDHAVLICWWRSQIPLDVIDIQGDRRWKLVHATSCCGFFFYACHLTSSDLATM